MDIRQFDVVLLKSGKDGTILEVFDKDNFLIEMADDNNIEQVNISDIEKVVWTAPQEIIS